MAEHDHKRNDCRGFPSYQRLYSGEKGALYSPDSSGRRFLVLTGEAEWETGADRRVVVNWLDALRGQF